MVPITYFRTPSQTVGIWSNIKGYYFYCKDQFRIGYHGDNNIFSTPPTFDFAPHSRPLIITSPVNHKISNRSLSDETNWACWLGMSAVIDTLLKINSMEDRAFHCWIVGYMWVPCLIFKVLGQLQQPAVGGRGNRGVLSSITSLSAFLVVSFEYEMPWSIHTKTFLKHF